MARKFGEGSLKAAARLGLKEVGRALPAFQDSIQPIEEPGAVGNPTTYDVSKQTGALETRDAHRHVAVEAIETSRSLKSQLQGGVHGKKENTKTHSKEHEPEPDMEP